MFPALWRVMGELGLAVDGEHQIGGLDDDGDGGALLDAGPRRRPWWP
jgi:hypothetical protein